MGNQSSPQAVAARLRIVAGDLVRAGRAADTLAPVPAAVMDLLDRHGPMTTADLAAARQVRHQTMATTIKELVEGGRVKAVPDASDGRKKLLRLTAIGTSDLERDREARVSRLSAALSRALDSDELRDLARALVLVDKVTEALAQDVRAEPAPDRGPITGDW